MHSFVILSVQYATRLSPIRNSLLVTTISSAPAISTLERNNFIVGAIISASFLSSVQEMNVEVIIHAAMIGVVAKITATGYWLNILDFFFFQLISLFHIFCAFLLALNMFQGMRSKVASGVSFRYCAYPWTAAVPTCLHIPMQLNKAYFTSTVPAPTLQTIPFLAFRAVNADKRYPRPCPLMHARKTGIPS